MYLKKICAFIVFVIWFNWYFSDLVLERVYAFFFSGWYLFFVLFLSFFTLRLVYLVLRWFRGLLWFVSMSLWREWTFGMACAVQVQCKVPSS
jgi:hypothetical protein